MIRLISTVFLWAISASQVLSGGYCAAVYVETYNPQSDRKNSLELGLLEFLWSGDTLVYGQGEDKEQTYKCSGQRCLWMASDFSVIEEIKIRKEPAKLKEYFAYSANWNSSLLEDVEIIDGVAVPRRVSKGSEVEAMLLCDAPLPEDWLVGELSAPDPIYWKDALTVSVSQCWNVGSLSTDALATTVVVAVSMAETGVPDSGSIRMVSFSGGSEAGARQAFEATRRAIIRCGARGFPLPVDKYTQWRDVEITFNPEGLQVR